MINSFSGMNRFLSNFYPCSVCLDGIKYPSVEHAYQAAKTLNFQERESIKAQPTPGAAKRKGQKVSKRPDWEIIKIGVMEDLLKQKFCGTQLGEQLAKTGEQHLEEGNYWGDTFWGVCRGVGKNNLGKILMGVRVICQL